MARFTENQLISFTKPASNTEEQKLDKAKNAIKTAINNDSKLSQKIEIFGQGSYANDTNVKNNSDIDINVMYKEGFYYKIPPNTKKEDFGIVNTSSYSFKEFKNDVEQALLNNFKGFKVNRKNKCISINIYGIDVDVVPTCTHRIFSLNGNFVEGVTLFTDNTNQQIINYPKQHIENGKNKNFYTHKKFKWLTRIYKRIRYKMIDDGVRINNKLI
ncbi:nucleotidyltransferase [Capnocytophaga genosp. AHN8471]|uniref:Nucleotidyltransferase n=1 Tax=Capnocytophaga genosp. AHN8471 TaxID=327574 RepID=A0ABS1YWP3_9FLAO|nr:nucleotidyltransferase [Capnocytophaga genosp. AHN8471]MBM0650448.1 nucleotidyltransferase [Capnocytophaga genosp. AHN8471]MBM0662695.1 nucleotidyltransferase [Capnocytophaga genosp. AHN8471]